MTVQLGLGTAQFGMNYGIANHEGQIPQKMVASLLVEAANRNITFLDTAAVYGCSEEVLGQNDLSSFSVVSKIPSFGVAEIDETHVDKLIRTFSRSIERLKCTSLYGLLAHHANDLLAPGGAALFEAMWTLKNKGLVQKIGASVYDGQQIDMLLARYDIDLIQLPLNVLDQRLVEKGYLDLLKKHRIEVHARSVFLQGLLLMELENIPLYFNPIRPLLLKWYAELRRQGLTALQGCLTYVRDLQGIDVVLVGVTSVQELVDCDDAFGVTAGFVPRGLAYSDPAFVNPARWRIS